LPILTWEANGPSSKLHCIQDQGPGEGAPLGAALPNASTGKLPPIGIMLKVGSVGTDILSTQFNPAALRPGE